MSNVVEFPETYESIRLRLQQVRKQLFLLESMFNNCADEAKESIALQINACKEEEHMLIVKAKRIMGERVNIPTSLREHRENQIEVQ